MAVQKKLAKATAGRFVADVKKMRERARRHMQSGAVTESYRADRAQVIKVLNDVLATEIVCVLRYKSHFYFSKGLDAEPARAEFLKHAGEEQQHADWVAERITQLGGEPNFDPKGLPERSHSEYGRHGNLITMIQEDLIAERVAIESYSEIVRWLGDDDMTTRRLMEDILKTEEEHADDMANLLAKVG
ncbi:MAG: ferritin-like domain-containing protein [Candidatus Binataceae bacterium]